MVVQGSVRGQTALDAPPSAVNCGMDDRDNHASTRRTPRPDRAERLAAALRANLKRRKAQSRGRADPPQGTGLSKDRPNHQNSDTKDR